jgi:hypothetical protein
VTMRDIETIIFIGQSKTARNIKELTAELVEDFDFGNRRHNLLFSAARQH